MNKKFQFLLDTGSDVTCLPYNTIQNNSLNLNKTRNIFKGANDSKIEVVGFLKMKLISKKSYCYTKVYFVKKIVESYSWEKCNR